MKENWINPGLIFFLFMFSTCSPVRQVLTYNIRYATNNDGKDQWEYRKEGLVQQILDLDPIIFGIQEGLHHQVEYLDRSLPGYQFIGVGRDDGKQAGEYSAIFYKHAFLDIEQSGTFWLSETPEKPSVGWDAAMERICTYGLFVYDNNEKLWIFNTHFDHRGEEARVKSSKLIIDQMEMMAPDDIPKILMGDFNLPAEHPSIQDIASHCAMLPYRGPQGNIKTTFNGFNPDYTGERKIDHIFLKDVDKIIQYEIVDNQGAGSFLSDHFPVIVKFRL